MADKLLITYLVLAIVFFVTTIVFAVLYGVEMSKPTPACHGPSAKPSLMNLARKTLAEIAPKPSTIMGDIVDYDKAKSLINADNSVPTTVIVFSERCGACHGLRRTLKAAIEEGKLSGVNVALLAHSDLNDLVSMFKVTGVPHSFRVNKGKILKDMVGNVPSDKLIAFLTSP
jgi:thioredoxin-like negative regulator of GroEL